MGRLPAASGVTRVTQHMPQCNVCMDDIDEEEDTHIEVVKPMEFKGAKQEIRHYYCTISCLLDQARE